MYLGTIAAPYSLLDASFVVYGEYKQRSFISRKTTLNATYYTKP
jgi:hypothetical protein